MKRVIALCILMSLCAGLYATGPDTPMTEEQIQVLRLAVAALASQLLRLVVSVETEDIGLELRIEIENTIEVCLAILDVLGYQKKAIPGVKG